MFDIIQQYDGQKPKVYATKKTFTEAKNLLNFIKASCILIGQSRIGFYAKATQEFSTPFTMLIQRGSK